MTNSRLFPMLLFVCFVLAGCSKKKSGGDGSGGDGGGAPGANVKVIEPAQSITPNFPPAFGKKAAVEQIALSNDGKRLAVSSFGDNETVQVWELGAKPRKILEMKGKLAALSPDGRRMVAWVVSSPTLIDVDTQKTVGQFTMRTDRYIFTPSGTVVGIPQSQDHSRAKNLTAYVFSAADAKQVSSFDLSDDDRVQVSTPFNGGREIAIAHHKSNLVRVWNIDTRQHVRDLTLTMAKADKMLGGAFLTSADGKTFVLERGNDVEVWDAAAGKRLDTFKPPVSTYTAALVPGQPVLLFASNMTRQDTSGSALDVVAFDLSQKSPSAAFRGHTAPIKTLAVSGNGKVLATGDAEGGVKVWDLGGLK